MNGLFYMFSGLGNASLGLAEGGVPMWLLVLGGLVAFVLLMVFLRGLRSGRNIFRMIGWG